jgi:hypothetical protein
MTRQVAMLRVTPQSTRRANSLINGQELHNHVLAKCGLSRSANDRQRLHSELVGNLSGGCDVTRLLALVFSAALYAFLFAFFLAYEASAQRVGGIQTGFLRDGSFRAVSPAVYRPGLRGRGYRGYGYRGYRATAWGGRRYWRGGRWYGYAARPYWRYGAAARAGAYGYGYGYGYSNYSGSVDTATRTATREEPLRSPGTCGTYFYWKDDHCADARLK